MPQAELASSPTPLERDGRTATDASDTSSVGWLRSQAGRVSANRGLTVLMLVPWVVFCAPLLCGRVFLEADNYIQNLPLRALAGREIAQGHPPLWNHLLFSGSPLLAGFHAAAAYPTSWLFSILPIFWAWSLNLACAYDIALLGMFLFLRRQPMERTAAILGAATFAFSGYVAGQIVHIDLIQAACWIPWMLLAVHQITRPTRLPNERSLRFWCIAFGLALAMALLSGGAEAVLDGSLMVGMYAGARLVAMLRDGSVPGRNAFGRAGWLAVGGGIGIGMSAIQWLPGLAFQASSQRSVATYDFFVSGQLPIRALVALVTPFFHGTGHPGFAFYTGPYNLPEVASYVGILPLIAASMMLTRRWRSQPEARQWWIWYAVFIVGLLAALGNQTPFGRLMFLVPIIDKERLLNRNLLLVDTALTVLFAWWAHVMLTRQGRRPEPVPRVGRLRESWTSGDRSGLVATCLPLGIVALATVGMWTIGTPFQDALGARYAVGVRAHLREAIIVTVGLGVAGAATFIVLRSNRWSTPQLRRALVAIVIADLVVLNVFLQPLPTAQGPALAHTHLANQFAHLTAGGRSIIFDPDRFYSDDLIALGQTDLNLYTGVASGQGYSALSDGTYSAVTGAHYQEDLDPNSLGTDTWDDLNAHTLLSLPSYFMTPSPEVGHPRSGIPFPDATQTGTKSSEPQPGPTIIKPGRSHTWYFGGALGLRSLAVSLELLPRSGPNGTATALPVADLTPARLSLVDPKGHGIALADESATWAGSESVQHLDADFGAARMAGGVTLTNQSSASMRVGIPEVVTDEAGRTHLDGPLQVSTGPPHWVFTGTVGPFGVFENARTKGWAWAEGSHGEATPAGTTVAAGEAGIDGRQEIVVHATGPIVLRRSEAWAEGWHATARQRGQGSSITLAVERSGLVQSVAIPEAGTWVISYRYLPQSVQKGLGISALSVTGVAIWALVVRCRSVARVRRQAAP